MNLPAGMSRPLPFLLLLGSALWPATLQGQSVCDVGRARVLAASGLHWDAPLSRRITVQATDIGLGDALDQVASAAHLRFSYSPDLIPLERGVCLAVDSAPAGAVLAELLRGTGVEAVAAGTDLVVLAPARTNDRAGPAPAEELDAVVPLDPVVVNAVASDPARRELPYVPGVLEHRQLAGVSTGTVFDALNGAVPGVWMWGHRASGLPIQWGSIRGASSFGLSSPKVYIDGIEVANPLLLSRLTPDAIERIEVIRGPQGAALYGADAINGVTSITTRHETLENGTPRVHLRSGIGLSATDYAAGSTVAQEHSLGLRLGSALSSAALDLNVGSMGEFIPGAGSRHVGASGSLRVVGSNSILNGTFRFLDERASMPASPLLADSIAGFANPGGGFLGAPEAIDSRQFTVGLRARWTAGNRWTHNAVIGLDGYSLSGLPDAFAAGLSPGDSALRAAGTGAVRGTLRMTSAARVDLGGRTESTLTVTAEHTFLRQDADSALYGPGSSRSSTGVGARGDVALWDRLFLTGGLRAEHNGSLEAAGLTLLPMLGGSWLASVGPLDVKLRAAYGKGIRWPDLAASQGQWKTLEERFQELRLGPEVQSGVEGGIDLSLGRAFKLQVTRFDQTASGLVQRVTFPAGGAERHGNGYHCPGGSCVSGLEADGRMRYLIQTVGVIANRGWELQSSFERGPLALNGTFSLVDSRVQRLAEGYSGDLREGDRMLGVPSRLYGLSAIWTAPRWSATIGMRGAADWMNYDAISLARALSGPDASDLAGPALRAHWRRYDGIPHLRVSLARSVTRDLTLLVSAENLLDHQLGEPDNITVQPGRTFSVGFRASF